MALFRHDQTITDAMCNICDAACMEELVLLTAVATLSQPIYLLTAKGNNR